MDRPEKRLRNPADDITDDLVVEILSRLPVKSVCRAKCVSWHWRGLIAHPLHRTRLPQTLSGFFCCDEVTASHGDGTTSSPYIVTDDDTDDDGGGHGTASSPYLIWDTDDEDDDDYNYVDIVTEISTPDFVSILPAEEEQSPVVPDPSLSFLSGAGYKSIFPKHGCDGHLLCLCWNVSPPTTSEPDYVVCNPATQQWRTIPRTHRRTKSDLPVPLSLCLDDDDDPASAAHFHVFALIQNRDMYITGVDIYSSETEAWSHHGNGWDDDGIMTLQPSVFLHGMLHLIAHARSRIVTVDRDGETWRTIPLLEGMDTAAYFCSPETAFIGKSQGRLHYMTNMPDDYFMLSVWMLEDYRRGRWVLRFRYNMNNPEVFGSRVPKAREAYNCVSIHPDYCNLIFLNLASQNILLKYDSDRGEARIVGRLKDSLHGKRYDPYIPYVPSFSRAIC